jgi:hypothetical protein
LGFGFDIVSTLALSERAREPRQAGFFETDNVASGDVEVFEIFRRDLVQDIRAIAMPKKCILVRRGVADAEVFL